MRASRDRVGTRRKNLQSGRPSTRYACWNLAECGVCGSRMRCVTTHKRKDGTRKRIYRCRHQHQQTGLCNAPDVAAEVVDSWIVGDLSNLVLDMDQVFHAMARDGAAERVAVEAELATVRRKLRRNAALQEKVEDDYLRQLEGGEEGADHHP